MRKDVQKRTSEFRTTCKTLHGILPKMADQVRSQRTSIGWSPCRGKIAALNGLLQGRGCGDRGRLPAQVSDPQRLFFTAVARSPYRRISLSKLLRSFEISSFVPRFVPPPCCSSANEAKRFSACYSAAAVTSCGKTFRLGEAPSSPSPVFWGRPANRRRALAIFTWPSTPVSTTSTIVKDEWK
jgi:hypothetical protein